MARPHNLHHARFADFQHLRPCAPVDLLVCSDVLHYLEARRWIWALRIGGCVAAWPSSKCSRSDGAVGDEHEFKLRSAVFYRNRLRALGLHPLGSHCWLSPALVASPLH